MVELFLITEGCVLSPVFTPCTIMTVLLNAAQTSLSSMLTTLTSELITDNDETAYRDEVQALITWCLTVKEMIVDYRRHQEGMQWPIYIDNTELERLKSSSG